MTTPMPFKLKKEFTERTHEVKVPPPPSPSKVKCLKGPLDDGKMYKKMAISLMSKFHHKRLSCLGPAQGTGGILNLFKSISPW